jgi:two-component SAPR family response regulator
MKEKTKIIIIDDDNVTVFLSRRILLNFDPTFEFSFFSSGIEAIDFVRNNYLDKNTIILLDINMPDYSGWDFLNDFMPIESTCHVFMFTSSIDLVDLEKSKTFSKVKGFISKPLTPDKIQKIISESVG